MSVLCIGGIDASRLAGLFLDSAIMQMFNIRGYCAISCVPSQSNIALLNIEKVHNLGDQIDVILSEYDIKAVKIGMLYSQFAIDVIAAKCKKIPMIVDTPFVSSSGFSLVESEKYIDSFVKKIAPMAMLLTPNVHELVALKNHGLDPGSVKNILVKGGHMENASHCVDVLYSKNSIVAEFTSERFFPNERIRGTGCALATAIACNVAVGMDVKSAISEAKSFVSSLIEESKYVSDNIRSLI